MVSDRRALELISTTIWRSFGSNWTPEPRHSVPREDARKVIDLLTTLGERNVHSENCVFWMLIQPPTGPGIGLVTYLLLATELTDLTRCHNRDQYPPEVHRMILRLRNRVIYFAGKVDTDEQMQGR